MKRLIMAIFTLTCLCSTAQAKNGLKCLPDGSWVDIRAVVTTSYYDYRWQLSVATLESGDRTQSIEIFPDASLMLTPGDFIEVWGTLYTWPEGDRAIFGPYGYVSSDDVTVLGSNFPPPSPIYLRNSSVVGAPVEYAPGIEGAMGPCNYSTLVTVTGKVVVSNNFGGPLYINDGSALPSDLPDIKALKVNFDNVGYAVGDFATITGIVTNEAANGQVYPALYLPYDLKLPHREPGTGTVAITINGRSEAADRQVRLYSDTFQRTVTLDSLGHATTDVVVRCGESAIYAKTFSYATEAQVINLTPDGASIAFTLERIPVLINVLPLDWRVPVGNSARILAIVYDVEGERGALEPLLWASDYGQFTVAPERTDDDGEAIAVLKGMGDKHVATVWAAGGDWISYNWVEFADENDPILRLDNPIPGQTVSGNYPMQIYHQDIRLGGAGNTVRKRLLVDDQPFGGFYMGDEEVMGDEVVPLESSAINSVRLPNGEHKITLWVSDGKGNNIRSNDVWVTVDNPISQAHLNQTELYYDEPNPQPFEYTAQVNIPASWTIEIKRCSDHTAVLSTSGTGPGRASISWDGILGGGFAEGLYEVIPTITPQGGTAIQLPFDYFSICRANGNALVIGKVNDEPEWARRNTIDEMGWFIDACHRRGVVPTVVLNPFWVSDTDWETQQFRRGMDYWLGKRCYHNLFMSTHGSCIECQDGVWRAYFDFADGRSVLWSNLWVEERWRGTTYEAFTDLHISADRWNVVMANGCNSAGSWQHNIDWGFEIAFGLHDDPSGGTFIGWTAGYRPLAMPILWGLSPNGAGWTRKFLSLLGSSYSCDQAEYWTRWSLDPTVLGWMRYFLFMWGDISRKVTWLE